MKYSFCESAFATSISPWCIRPLTDVGRKLSGGIDTPSLCGRVHSQLGWDLNTPVDLSLSRVCKKCAQLMTEDE